jgi:hypothetical protein
MVMALMVVVRGITGKPLDFDTSMGFLIPFIAGGAIDVIRVTRGQRR